MTEIVSLSTDTIRRDGGTQMRVAINEDKVTEYADLMIDDHEFPPVVVFFDGHHRWLADGFHRIAAREQVAIQLKGTEAYKRWQVINAELRDGTQYDAILYAIKADSTTGLARTNEDKRKAVMAALSHPAMKEMSNREIAREVGVSFEMVRKQREVTTVVTAKQPTDINGKTTAALVQIDENAVPAPKPHKAVDTATDRRRQAQSPKALSSSEQKAKALELSSKGMSASAIADALGRGRETIRGWIASPESPVKEFGSQNGRKKDLDEAKISSLFHDGKSVAEIAVEMDSSPEKIRRYLRNLGLSKAGKRKESPLEEHTSIAESQAFALETALESIVAKAMVSTTEQVKALSLALGRLEAAAKKLKVRLNKDAGKG